jgi:glycosyltransferase involved in cell wall biosynthesis
VAQVIKKRTIVLASVLKPVNDTRMYEKLGTSLAARLEAAVHIIGFPETVPHQTNPGITFHPLGSKAFHRLSVARFIAPGKILLKVIRLKPSYLVITTHELLWVALICKIWVGCRIIYDVQENYFSNILFTRVFPPGIRQLLATYVRTKEWITAPFIHCFLLAEKGYSDELRFAKPYLIIENKLPRKLADRFGIKQNPIKTKLIFSGTIAPTTGIFEAIELARKLHVLEPEITLTVIGHCPAYSFLKKLKAYVSEYAFIRLIVSAHPIAHEKVLDELSHSSAGIIIYPPNPSTQSSLPTKLYEYLAIRLPVLIRHNDASHDLVTSFQAGIVLTANPDPVELLEKLAGLQVPAAPESVYWESTEDALIRVFD